MTGAFPSKKIGATSLMYACQQGKETRVIDIVSAKPGAVLERERTLKTALHYCAESGDGGVSSAAVLLEAAPELVLAQDQDGYSALHLAVIAGNLSLAKLIISHGAPINMPDNEGHTPAHWATVCGEIECLELLLGKGCDPNMGDMHGGCPLHYAAQMCGPFSDMPADRRLGMAALRILLDKSSDPNLPDNHGRQPILWAASAGSSEAILVLVGAGANVTAADKDGLTALHCAASRGHTDCVETLINLCSAEPDVIDNNGCSALFYAVTLGHADATQTLLNHGANTNRQDRKGRTAVHCGAAKGQLETLKVVAAWGGNLWQKTVRGDYPLHDAVASGRRPLVQWLLSQRPDSVNSPNNDGRCPLHIAALHNNIEMCKTLLDAGSLVNPVMRTAKGALATPLDAALHKGHRGCAKYLQLHGGVPSSRLNSESAALRGLSSSRGDSNRAGAPQVIKEDVEDKPQAVEPLEVAAVKADNKRLQIELPASDDQNLIDERERSTTRPHILQVYVEDDLMIRKLRHYEGSDSSIEERVRRRRRKRKTKLMSEREKSAPARISPRRLSSSDEITDRPHSQQRREHRDIQGKDIMVEKLVQTEFSVQPGSLPSEFESMLVESSKDDTTNIQREEKYIEEDKGPQKVVNAPVLETSSCDSDKKSNVQIIEALVHEVQKSGDADENESSLEERMKGSSNEEIVSTIKLNESLTVEDETSRIQSIDQPLQPQIADKVDSAGASDAVEQNNNVAGSGVTVDLSSSIQNNVKENNDKPGSISEHTSIENQDDPIQEKVVIGDDTTGNVDSSTRIYEKLGSDKIATATDKENNGNAELPKETGNGNNVPNDKLVAAVLIQSFHDNEETSAGVGQLSTTVSNEGDEKMKEQTEGEKVVKETTDLVQRNDVPDLDSLEDHGQDLTEHHMSSSNDSVEVPDSAKEKDAKNVDAIASESSKVASLNDESILQSTTTILEQIEDQNRSAGSLPGDGVPSSTIASDLARNKLDDQGNFSKDSFDIDGSLDELTLNITKDSDDAPPELGLPEPIVDENWSGKAADSADVNIAHIDRGLIKVLGDPTGGSSYAADKRRKLKKKREGNKKWMNSRTTESFEVLKISDEKTDDETISDLEKPLDDDVKSSNEESKLSPSHQRTKITRACRKRQDSNMEAALSTVSVTQAVQYSVRKYHLERRIFHQLLELKRLQIRAGRASEAVLVKRLVDEYKRAGLMLGLQQYDGVYTFRSFEKFLYEQLRLLQTSERRIIPRLRSTDDLERLTAALRKTRVGQEILASVPNNPALCTYQTHRCHHATHAYTGIPCAAYIARSNHHTMPKPSGYSGFLPKLVNDESQGEVAKTLRHVDPTRPLTLELTHGPDKQVITLPTEKLDKSKKYFVTFTIKSGNQRKNELKHSHATSI